MLQKLKPQMQHVLRYLRYSRNYVLCYSKVSHGDLDLSDTEFDGEELNAFADSDHEPQRSVTSSLVICNNAALLWRVKKQATVSLSTVQSELTALSSTAQDVEMCHDLFDWFDMPVQPTVIFCDNKGAIQNAKHPNFSDKLRHAQNKIYYIREVIAGQQECRPWRHEVENSRV